MEKMDIFCSKHKNCEESISVIVDILSSSHPSHSKNDIEKAFNELGFKKVKDLARSTLGIASTMSLGGDPLAKLYGALETYDSRFADRLENAKIEYQNGHFNKTKELCHEMLLCQPTDINVLNLLGLSYFSCSDFDHALEFMEKAFDLNPTNTNVLFNMGSIYWKKSKFKEALECYHKVITEKPAFIDGWLNYSSILIELKDFPRAVSLYKLILRSWPTLHEVRNSYGKLLLFMNNVKEAKEQFKITIKNSPDYPDSWNSLGNLYFINSKLSKAIFNYEKAVQLDPNLTTTWINLGVAYLKIKEYEKAINGFQKAIQLCPTNIAALTNLALTYDCQDNIPLTISTFKKLQVLKPKDFDLNFKLGLMYLRYLNDYQEAEKYFQNCIQISPQTKDSYKYLTVIFQNQDKIKCAADNSLLLGDLYFDQNDMENAKNTYLYAIYLDPENAEGHWKLGLAMYKMGYLDMALMRFKKAIELKPNFPDVHCDCALIYETRNLLKEAITHYNLALSLDSRHINTLYNISNLHTRLGQYDIAVKRYKQILELDDSEAFDIHLELANILYKHIGNFHEAIFYYEKVIEVDNTVVDAHFNLGNIFLELKKYKEALNCFNNVIQLDTQYTKAYDIMASIHKKNNNFIEAIQLYKTALSIDSSLLDVYCNLVNCLQYICDWSDYDLHAMNVKEKILTQLDDDLIPFLLPLHSSFYSFLPEQFKQIALKHGDYCFKKAKQLKKENFAYNSSFLEDTLIRVGYVYFGDHPASQFMHSISSFHDKKKLKIFSYSISPTNNSSFCSTLSNELDNFKDISAMSVKDAAEVINNDKIQLLITTNSFSNCNLSEIFALKPAPIQIMLSGYPGTSGASFIDYLITDKICSPIELEHLYIEKLIYMKHSVFIGAHKQLFKDLKPPSTYNTMDTMIEDMEVEIPMNNENNLQNSFGKLIINNTMSVPSVLPTKLVINRKTYNLPEDVVVYCNFGNVYKIVPSTFKMWAAILHNVPNSVLWLLHFSAAAEENLRNAAASLNIDNSRIIFGNLEPKETHIRRIQLADIFLDTPVCNSYTTCLDALWAGIPIITLPGETFASRVAASQLTALECTVTIVHTEEDYIKIATQLGLNKYILEALKSNIWHSRMNSVLFNCKSYVDELEIIYKDILNTHK